MLDWLRRRRLTRELNARLAAPGPPPRRSASAHQRRPIEIEEPVRRMRAQAFNRDDGGPYRKP